jgi:hypothetical protein
MNRDLERPSDVAITPKRPRITTTFIKHQLERPHTLRPTSGPQGMDFLAWRGAEFNPCERARLRLEELPVRQRRANALCVAAKNPDIDIYMRSGHLA